MAMPLYSGDDYQDLVNYTRSAFSKELIDSLERSCPLMSKICGKNNVRAGNFDGKRFVVTILARAVDNVKAVAMRDELDTDYVQLSEQIEVEPKLLYQGVTVNSKELAINDTNKLFDLLETNQRGIKYGFQNAFSRMMYDDGRPLGNTKALSLNGLGYMVSDNPYEANLTRFNLLRGGTPGDKYEFWRNRAGEFITGGTAVNSFSTTDIDANAKKLLDAMTLMLLTLNGVSEVASLEKIEPVIDGIYMSYYFYQLLDYAKRSIMHIENVKEQKTDIGFTSMSYMGVPVYLDKFAPQNKIYFVDSSQIQLLYVPGENFKQDIMPIPRSFAKQYITSFMGNFIIEKARNCGVIVLESDTTSNGLPSNCNVCIPNSYVDYDYVAPTVNAAASKAASNGSNGTKKGGLN